MGVGALSDPADFSALFHAFANHFTGYIAVIDAAGCVRYLNRTLSRPIDELIGQPFERFVAPETRELAVSEFRLALEGRKARTHCFQALLADGSERTFEVTNVPSQDAQGNWLVLQLTADISKAKQEQQEQDALRAQLAHAQRLESVGMLAGGIAHEFNNLLQVIMSNIDFALHSNSPKEDLLAANRAARRAADLTSQLLTIARRRQLMRRSVNFADSVQRTVGILRSAVSRAIGIYFQAEPGPFVVRGDRSQLEQALITLFLNSKEDMPDGGSLEIELKRDDQTGQVLLRVEDSGVGMSESECRHLFDPFFASRVDSESNGLGMAFVQGVVDGHAGTIRVRSVVDEGTIYEIRLPLTEMDADAPQSEPTPTGGNECVLVAEDEPAVRTQVVRILSGAGYEVLEAENGEQAIAVFEENRDRIHLVLMDAVMPGLDGWQAFTRIRELDPRATVLFSSGYAAGALPSNLDAHGVELLNKPYTPGSLLNRVRRALSTSRSSG